VGLIRDESKFGSSVGWVAARGLSVSIMRRFPEIIVSGFSFEDQNEFWI
jgi:hypothetical protein